MIEYLKQAKESSYLLSNIKSSKIDEILHDMANALEENSTKILQQNKLDVQNGIKDELSDAIIDRLVLNEDRIFNMANAIRDIASLASPVSRVLDGWETKDGLQIQKVSVPIGVIGIIYESRPNVTSDTAALCFKSKNICVLKGGKEAINSNKIIATILQNVLLEHNLPKNIISLVADCSREGVKEMIKQDKYIDLIIPRGGENLIKFVNENATISVVKHDKGLCHTYVDKFASIDMGLQICVNAKCQRPGVCNAMESLLVHKDIADSFLPQLIEELKKQGTKLKGCKKSLAIVDIEMAEDIDWDTEYLDNILSIKVVDSLDEAIAHINHHGSSHSEAIITEDYSLANRFLKEVDAACCYVNASTRFTDGGSFGLGAEVGISTNKLHARGPMGISDLTTYKYIVRGNGNIRK